MSAYMSDEDPVSIPESIPKPPNLRQLAYSPTLNPLLDESLIQLRRRTVRVGGKRDLLDTRTGEVAGMAAIHVTEIKDDKEFVKVFSEGVRAAFGLTKTGFRVFQAVLDVYQATSMSGGYAEAVELFFFDGKLDGRALDMSEKTFQRGLKELLANRFLHPRSPGTFWVNPNLFFKGDRVAFIREYRKKSDQQKLESK